MTPEETLRQALLEDKFPESDEKPIIPIADPLKYNRMTAVSAWMGNLTGQDISPEDIGWQAEKDALAQSFFKMPDAKDVSDETVHDLIRSHIQTSDNATDIALNSALTGRPLAQTLNEIQALAGVSKTRGIRDRYVSAASSLYSDIAAKRNVYSDVINKVSGSLGEMLKKTDTDIGMTDVFNDAAERLMGVPAEDRRLVIEAIAATGNATAEERSSYLSKVEWRVNRMAETLGAASVSNLSNALESVLDLAAFGSGLADPRDVAGAAPEGNKSRELSLLAQQIRTAANEKLDPIKSNSWISKQGLALADMATQSGVALVNPLAGFAVNLAYFNDTMGADVMTQNPGLTVEQADKITAIGAPVNAAIETITALIPFGKVKLPFVQKWLMAETASVGGALRNFGIRASVGTATEIGEEWLQAYTPLKVQELMRAMGQDMPAVDWERNMPKFADIAAEVWAPALVFSIVGAGAASINDINNGRSLASDLDLLIARGIAPETAAKIKDASDLGDYNKVDSLFREEFVNETKASKPDIQAATERLKARFRDQSSIDVLQDATSPEYTAKVIRTATGWQVQTGDGNVVTTETKEAADQIYSKIRQVGNQKEAEVITEILEYFYSSGMGRGAQVEMTGETTMAQEIKAGEGRVFAERRDASGGLISQRQFGPQALETVRAEAEAAGIQTDTRGIFARINGSNEVFPQQVGDTAKGIWRILSLFESRKNATPQVATLLHEDIESKFALGLINKSWTVGDIQKAFAGLLPAFANITAPIVQTDEQIAKMSKSAQEAYYAKQSEFNWINNVRNIVDGKFDAATLRETFSEMYVRDRFALDRKGLPTGLPAGLISRGIEASIMGATTQEEAGIYKRFRAMFKAFSAHFKAVFKTVQTMVAARKEGKIGEDWDSFVNKVLGIDEVKQMESQAVDEVKAMLGIDEEAQAVIDAGNMAFSTSRAQPADTSNVTEMPDGAQLVGPTTFSIEAYHGTPHEVDRFRMAKIGTGEGKQAFGWGLYFAKKRAVAEMYLRAGTDRLAKEFDTPSGKVAVADLPEILVKAFEANWEAPNPFRNAENFLNGWNGEYYAGTLGAEALTEAKKKLTELIDQGATVPKSNLYTVELLPDEEDFLDWDKPLSEQSDKVKAALVGVGESPADIQQAIDLLTPRIGLEGRQAGLAQKQIDELKVRLGNVNLSTGAQFYNRLGEAKAASEMLAKAGIPGIRYLDGGSRAAGEGTSNYVIFDENLVKIIEKNGQKVESPTFSISPIVGARNAASAVNFKENPSIINPQKTKGRVKVIDLARALDQRAVDLGYKREANDYSQETIDHISDAMAEEIAYMLQRDGSGVGWYDVKINSALDLMSRVYPELNTDPEAKLRFLVMVASISQGNAVDLNFEFADRAYGEYRTSKQLPTFPYPGKSNEDITRNIAFLFEMIDKIGAEDTFKLLKEVKTVREWNKLGYEVTGEVVDAKVTGAMAIMGSKIGSFFGNLNGDFTSLTADLWFSRSWNRYTGNMESLVGDGIFDDIRQILQPLRGKSILHGFSKADIMSNDDVAAKWVAIVAKDYAQGGFKDKTPLNVKANTAAKKLAGETNDAPRGGVERQAMRATVASAIQKVVALGFPELTMADAQAILWFNEKDLFQIYKAVNKTGAKTDYETAAQDVVKSHGLNYTVSDQFRRNDGGAIQPRVGTGEKEFNTPLGDESRANQKADNKLTFSISPAQDAEYLAAAKAGDTETAQRLVDQLAMSAGYNSPKLYHGTGAEFSIFDKKRGGSSTDAKSAKIAFFFTDDEATAKAYAVYAAEEGPVKDALKKAELAEKRGDWDGYDAAIQEAESLDNYESALKRRESAKVVSTYLKGDFLEFDAKGKTPQELSDGDTDKGITNQLLKAQRAGKTGVLFKNLDDAVNLNNRPSNHYAVFKPDQIKSADPITYDNAGNIIPLSQRFNQASPDIRFSISPVRNLNELSDQVEKQFAENPVGALEVKSRVIRQFAKLADKWSNERWTPQGNKIRPISEKRTVKSLDKEQAMRQARALDEILANQGFTSADAMKSKDAKDYEAWQRFQESKDLLLSGGMTEEEAQKLAGASASTWRKNFVNAIREATKKAKAEAQAWRDETDATQKEDWSPRESLVRDLITLEAIVAMFPVEIRGKIGGFVALARKASESARLKVLQKQLERGQVLLEKHLKEQYNVSLLKMLDKAAPVGKPGEIKKSKFIVTVQDELDAISEIVGMDSDDVTESITTNEAAIISAQTPEAADAALTRLNLLELFGGILDLKRTSSQEMEVAHEYLAKLMKQGREARKIIDEARSAKVKEMVATAKADAFKGQTGPETTQAARAKAAKESGMAMLKKFFGELSGFDAVLRDAFGPQSETARSFSERFTLNSNDFEDVQNERRTRFRDFARELYQTKFGAKINQKLIKLERIENNSGVTYLKNREVKSHKFTEADAAKIVADPKAFGFTDKDAAAISEEIQAIQNSGGRRKVFTYDQIISNGERVEIPLSQMDAVYISMALRQPGILEQQERHGYDQQTVDELDKYLTDEAKAWRRWMQTEYDAEYQRANEVYMRMFNARMPMIMFYAPLLKNHQGQQAILDPLNTGISSNSANPGSIKTRKGRTSSLRIESALTVFWAHFNQMEYWIANAEYLRDVQAVLLNPEVRESVVASHGEDGMATISAWVQLQMSRGVGKAAMATAGNKMFRNVKTGLTMKALALSYTTALKTLPSVFYSLGEIHMSKWPAALVSGMTHWNRLWKTNIIQRRLDIGGMPELRDLGSSAMPMSWMNQLIKYGSAPAMYADGVFTTFSAAMAYGVNYDEAIRQGASEDLAHKHAEERTALIVSRTAQPENWTQKSLLENDVGAFGSMFTLFMSDPRQKMALTGAALNQFRKGNVTGEEAARKFLAYWVIPGIMFQLANAIGRSLFKGDDDEWEVVDFATAALVGQFQGLVLLGSGVEMIFSAAIAAAAEKITGEEVKRKPFWNSSKNPLDQAAQDLIKSAENLNDTNKDVFEKTWEVIKSVGLLTTWLNPAGAVPATVERVIKDTANLFYGAEDQ